MSTYVNVPGQGRIYRRGKVWYLDYWANGVRIREKSGGNKESALRELGTKTSDVSRGNLGFLERKKAVHFVDYADEYLKIKVGGPKPNRSIRSIRGYVSHLKDFFGELPLSRITSELVEEYANKRVNDKVTTKRKRDPKRDGKGKETVRTMKGQSVNRELATLRNLFNIALKKKVYRGDNPVADVPFFPEPRRRHHILDLVEYNRLLEAADPRLQPIILVAVRTGLRKNDIVNLRRKDIDFERGVLTAWVSKTQEWQKFQVGLDLSELLRELPEAGEYLFTNPATGRRWNDISKWWAVALKKVGLDQPGFLRFHDLRANAGTRAEEKAGAFAAQDLLGHKSRKTTEIYLNLTPERALAAAKALNEFYGTAQAQTGGTDVAQARTTVRLTSNDATH